MKPHIKVIQRNGVDVFVTSSMEYKKTKLEADRESFARSHADDIERVMLGAPLSCSKDIEKYSGVNGTNKKEFDHIWAGEYNTPIGSQANFLNGVLKGAKAMNEHINTK